MKNKLQILYIVIVFLFLAFFSTRSYNVGDPSFYVPSIIIALAIGVIGIYLFGKDMRLYKNLYFLSYVITIGIAFVPVIGVFIENGNRFYGFPAQWLSYYLPSGYVSLHLLGFLFNFFLIYFLLRILSKMVLRFSKNEIEWNNG
ncbi:hypothetical protein ACERII_10085 [Evansella sp. AB-rgal1]|uniref:hypothetical protein n=1 Tax=Evansella sp. AB-rgal1 TaxID=3242696 RepID=UPI00359EF0B2